jgi:hypothetical protein
MKILIAFCFTLTLLSVHSQGYASWWSLDSFVNYFDDMEVMVPYAIKFTRQLPDVVYNTSENDFSNFSYVILESLFFEKDGNFKYKGDPATHTITTVGGVISLNVSFNWASQVTYEIYPYWGIGWASLKSNKVTFNKTLNYVDGAQNFSVAVEVDWGDWNVSLGWEDRAIIERMEKVAAELLKGAVGNQITSTVEQILNERYHVVNKNWPYTAVYLYKQLELRFSNAYDLLNITEDHVTLSRNGTLWGFPTTYNMTKEPFDKTDEVYQVVMTRDFIQNFVQYTAVRYWFNWDFYPTNLPLDQFAYTVGDLATIYPDILTNYSSNVPVFLSCYDDALVHPNVTFNAQHQSVEAVFRFICHVVTDDNHQDLIYAFDFLAKVASHVRFDPFGNSIAVFKKGEVIGDVQSEYKIKHCEQSRLTQIVQEGFATMEGEILYFGTYFFIPMLNPRVNITGDYLFVYGDYVPFPIPTAKENIIVTF